MPATHPEDTPFLCIAVTTTLLITASVLAFTVGLFVIEADRPYVIIPDNAHVLPADTDYAKYPHRLLVEYSASKDDIAGAIVFHGAITFDNTHANSLAFPDDITAANTAFHQDLTALCDRTAKHAKYTAYSAAAGPPYHKTVSRGIVQRPGSALLLYAAPAAIFLLGNTMLAIMLGSRTAYAAGLVSFLSLLVVMGYAEFEDAEHGVAAAAVIFGACATHTLLYYAAVSPDDTNLVAAFPLVRDAFADVAPFYATAIVTTLIACAALFVSAIPGVDTRDGFYFATAEHITIALAVLLMLFPVFALLALATAAPWWKALNARARVRPAATGTAGCFPGHPGHSFRAETHTAPLLAQVHHGVGQPRHLPPELAAAPPARGGYML